MERGKPTHTFPTEEMAKRAISGLPQTGKHGLVIWRTTTTAAPDGYDGYTVSKGFHGPKLTKVEILGMQEALDAERRREAEELDMERSWEAFGPAFVRALNRFGHTPEEAAEALARLVERELSR